MIPTSPRSSGGRVAAPRMRPTLTVACLALLASAAVLGASPAPRAAAAEPCPQEALREAQGATALPDCRGWELVSPPNKHGATIEPIGFRPLQAAADGAAITYNANGSVVPDPPSSLLQEARALSARGPAGWSTQVIQAPQEEVVGTTFISEYELFSPDLSLGLLAHPPLTPPLAPGVSGQALYLRDNAAGTYEPIADTAEFGPAAEIAVASTSPDLRHILLSVGEGQRQELYEWSAGHAQLIDHCAGVPSQREPARHSLSADGSRLVWETVSGECEGHTGEPQLYLTDPAADETIRLDALQQGGSGAGRANPVFQAASADGSRVFFTDTQQLTDGSTASSGAPDLYEFHLTSAPGQPLAGELTDLTVPLHPGESGHMRGLLIGASEDGSAAYFLATGVLATNQNSAHEAASAGGDNLYLAREVAGAWQTEFIAGLGAGDGHDWSGEGGFVPEGGPSMPYLGRVTSRVSPNGRFLAFMSQQSLTGYDNRDAQSGEPDEEVFLYDAQTQRLTCASCNPEGKRPQGILASEGAREGTTLLIDRPEIWQNRWLAASIPGWSSIDISEALSQPRYLSDSGRLFFDSADSLLPRDTNDTEDVYEYEPPGVGSCTASSAGFSPASGGCVDLISSGVSGEESAFLDASESGDDVFFLTLSRLVPADLDNDLDLYDAHVCGAAAVPCTSQAISSSSTCASADSCLPAPQRAPSQQVPASSSPRGNEEAPPPPRCKPGFIRSHGRCIKKRNAHRHRKHRRAAAPNRGVLR